jgi:hypothetical protein
MRASRILACLAALVFLCGCGSSAPKQHHHTTLANPCRTHSDKLIPDVTPLIEVQPPGGSPQPVTTTMQLGCSADVSVVHRGSVETAFGRTASCTLTVGKDTSGEITNGYPATYFFKLDTGEMTCTFEGNPVVPICGSGSLSLTGTSESTETCGSNPGFEVAVHLGSVEVHYRNGHAMLRKGQGLVFDALTDQATPVHGPIFTVTELKDFSDQASELGLPISGR